MSDYQLLPPVASRSVKRKASISEQLDALQSDRDVFDTGSYESRNEEADKKEGSYIKGQETSILKKLGNGISIAVILLEHIITSIVFFLPQTIIDGFTFASKKIFSLFKENNDEIYNEFLQDKDFQNRGDELRKVEMLRNARTFEQICEFHGFKSESHLVTTEDGYQLTVHRLNPRDNGYLPNGKTVYLQHGLMMTSDIWCCMLNRNDNLPLRLCQLGYDVFLGNNRGNKYSCKHLHLTPNQNEFWDFSIDEFAMYDIPSSINYILQFKKIYQLTFIGFSQGTSQILSSISINKDLNDKIDKLILISPATTPKKLSNWLINSIINFRPSLIYILFGKGVLMKSVLIWKSITYPPMFIKLIDLPNDILFNWKSKNIDISQKLISYYHLFSTTSVKCIVHWFQIIKSKKFQMYQDNSLYQPFEYPTKQAIKIKKLCLIFGMNDSLVDIDIIVNQLPTFETINYTQMKDKKVVKISQIDGDNNYDTSFNEEDSEEINEKRVILMNNNNNSNLEFGSQFKIYGIEDHEHLDLLWGKDLEANVINNVINFLEDE